MKDIVITPWGTHASTEKKLAKRLKKAGIFLTHMAALDAIAARRGFGSWRQAVDFGPVFDELGYRCDNPILLREILRSGLPDHERVDDWNPLAIIEPVLVDGDHKMDGDQYLFNVRMGRLSFELRMSQGLIEWYLHNISTVSFELDRIFEVTLVDRQWDTLYEKIDIVNALFSKTGVLPEVSPSKRRVADLVNALLMHRKSRKGSSYRLEMSVADFAKCHGIKDIARFDVLSHMRRLSEVEMFVDFGEDRGFRDPLVKSIHCMEGRVQILVSCATSQWLRTGQ